MHLHWWEIAQFFCLTEQVAKINIPAISVSSNVVNSWQTLSDLFNLQVENMSLGSHARTVLKSNNGRYYCNSSVQVQCVFVDMYVCSYIASQTSGMSMLMVQTGILNICINKWYKSPESNFVYCRLSNRILANYL